MSNCQIVNITPTDTCLISLEFPSSFYEQAKPSLQPFVLKLFKAHRLLEKRMPLTCNWVIGMNICRFIKSIVIQISWGKIRKFKLPCEASYKTFGSYIINATSPAKTQRVTHTFSAVQQDCLNLNMEAHDPSKHPELRHIPAEPNNKQHRWQNPKSHNSKSCCLSQLPNSVISRPAKQLSAVQPL